MFANIFFEQNIAVSGEVIYKQGNFIKITFDPVKEIFSFNKLAFNLLCISFFRLFNRLSIKLLISPYYPRKYHAIPIFSVPLVILVVILLVLLGFHPIRACFVAACRPANAHFLLAPPLKDVAVIVKPSKRHIILNLRAHLKLWEQRKYSLPFYLLFFFLLIALDSTS